MNSSDSSEDKKPFSTPEVVPMMSKISENKLTSPITQIGVKQSASTYRVFVWPVILIRTLLLMIRKTNGWKMMLVSSYKFVIPLTVKYSPSLITVSMLKN